MTPVPRIIGLTGYAQHGKNTVGEVFEGLGYKQVGFADQLKKMALVLDPIVYATIDPGAAGEVERLSDWVEAGGWEAAKKNPEVRRFLQVLGTEAVRDMLGENSWVNALVRTFIPGQKYVITDVRFPNEARAITGLGGEVWRVVRPNFDNGVDPNHPSEASISSLRPHVTLVNDSDIDRLKERAAHVIGARGLARGLA